MYADDDITDTCSPRSALQRAYACIYDTLILPYVTNTTATNTTDETPPTTHSPDYYYGYRYYSPELGRWPSRDPIRERGGVESVWVRG